MPDAGVDRESHFLANYPTCPFCGGPARPSILMFEDAAWVDSAAQDRRYREWVLAVRSEASELEDRPLKVVVLEVGAGGNVTTVRCESEHVFKGADNVQTTLVRINPELPLPDMDLDKLEAGNVHVVSRVVPRAMGAERSRLPLVSARSSTTDSLGEIVSRQPLHEEMPSFVAKRSR